MNPIISEVEHDTLQTLIFNSDHQDFVKLKLGKKILLAKNLVTKLQRLREEFHQMKHNDGDFIHEIIQAIDQTTKEADG